MSESKHTPGPWSLWRGPQYDAGGEDICIGAGNEWVANMDHREPRCPQIAADGHFEGACDICSIDSDLISAEQLANAHLIAAAPEMLEALEETEEMLSAWADPEEDFAAWDVIEQARAALAKARGEEEKP